MNTIKAVYLNASACLNCVLVLYVWQKHAILALASIVAHSMCRSLEHAVAAGLSIVPSVPVNQNTKGVLMATKSVVASLLAFLLRHDILLPNTSISSPSSSPSGCRE